ncbi:MAG: peptide ABC transporter permease [Chloroflexi bacterium RBG_16_68_14]|nr:MAG: peptide ABC transporter permease [Chloroflexi bacterium RBG_16_68_14]
MAAYLVRRILWIGPVLFAVALITFVLMHQVPGGPWDRAKRLPPQALENVNLQYGLDQPVWEQFGRYLLDLAQGDLGASFRSRNRPVADVLADGIRVSATLGLLALAVSVTVGVGLGVVSALRRNTVLDYAAVAFATVGASVPSFILGMLLLVLFTARLHWLPSGGWGSPQQAVMPVAALSALPAAYIARVTRASMLDVLQQEYVRTARAKGLRERAVVLRHMLRNALIPVLTVIGPVGAMLVTGSFVVEHLFAIPGIGRTFVNSISARDYGVIMGTTLFYTFVVAVANLVVDALYAVVDPRIRYEAHG